jgi:hypothetical protein
VRVGQRVQMGLGSHPLYGVRGRVVKEPLRAKNDSRPRTWIRWDGNVLSNGYLEGDAVLEALVKVEE